MTDVFRFALTGDFQARLIAVLPGLTRSDLEAFSVLVVRDCLIGDDGGPHPELLAWVQRILDRRAGGAVAVPVVPVPKTGPAGAEVMA